MTIETSRQDIGSIQMLRGIAALMVVMVHVLTQVGRMGVQPPQADWLNAGVDIFFVISGFIMWVSTERAPGRTAGQFLMHRLIRIVPLYWSLTLAMALLMLVTPQIFQTGRFDAVHLAKSLLFIAARHPTTHFYWPVLIPGWTLNYEMFFYLLFAAALYLSRGSAVFRGLLVGLFILAAVAAASAFHGALGDAAFYGNNIVIEFLLGIGIGAVYLSGAAPRSYGWWLLVPAGLLLLVLFFASPAVPRFVSGGVPAMLVVAGAALAKPVSLRALHGLGDSSYSLYLTHVITVSAVSQFWRLLHLTWLGPLVFALVAVSLSVCGGAFVYLLVERPLTRSARRLVQRRSADPTPVQGLA